MFRHKRHAQTQVLRRTTTVVPSLRQLEPSFGDLPQVSLTWRLVRPSSSRLTLVSSHRMVRASCAWPDVVAKRVDKRPSATKPAGLFHASPCNLETARGRRPMRAFPRSHVLLQIGFLLGGAGARRGTSLWISARLQHLGVLSALGRLPRPWKRPVLGWT